MVTNDNLGIKRPEDFPLFVNGVSALNGVAKVFPVSATYTVTETPDSNYTSTFSGDCNANGVLDLSRGNNLVCTITNDDIVPAVAQQSSGGGGGGGSSWTPSVPPLIDVVKVPNPLALPDGPGSVMYTYTLRNTGTVPVGIITMVGDTCSPITLLSGDVDSDTKLDVNETWTYTCSTTLSETHTNTVVATGWANGISATDIASATVVVGVPVVPPLIHVTKIPNPLALPAGGGIVTYTKKITNPGTVALSNIHLADDKCAPLNYISGDTNDDLKLDTTETWTYTCRTNLSKTTTNTAIATGEANGLTARDFAIATVVVAAPGFPSAGLPSEGKNIPAYIALLSSVLVLVSMALTVVTKK